LLVEEVRGILPRLEELQNLAVEEEEVILMYRPILLEGVQFTEEVPEVLEEEQQRLTLWLMGPQEEDLVHTPQVEVERLEQVGLHQHQVLQVQMEHLNFVDMVVEVVAEVILQILEVLLEVKEEVREEEVVEEVREQQHLMVVLEELVVEEKLEYIRGNK
jgi:hypothetical protein